MEAVKPVYLLLICQGFYSVGQSWTFPKEVTALIGSCVEIPCTYSNTRNLRSSHAVWYLYDIKNYLEILNTKDSYSVLEEYIDRTSLVPGEKSCTLRIDPVRREDGRKYYYPGITEVKSINAYTIQSRYVYLNVRDVMDVQLHGSGTMTEGETTTIECSADHTCRSSPPTIQWNKPGGVTQKSVENNGGSWREESQLTYIPTYVDDWSDIQCTITYPNGQKAERSLTLNINYAPKNVTVIIRNQVKEGSDVTLQCNSVSNPDVSEYEWYKGKEKSKLQDTGREIIVRRVTGNMEAYSCAAINTVGRGESALMDISVLYGPKNVTVTIIGKEEVMEGSYVTLQCSSVSNPKPSRYEWYKGKEKSRLQYTGREITVKVTGDTEAYSCTAINRVGRGESALMEIPVLYGPKNVTVTIIGKDEVIEGSDVTLQCNSVSNPKPYTYIWYKGEEKTRLQDTGQKIIVKVTGNMEAYSCTAINTVGRGESNLTEIRIQYKGFSIGNIILHATIGAICLLLLVLLVLLVYYCWRKRCRKLTTNQTNSSPFVIYTDLVKNEIQRDYDKLETNSSPFVIYTDLVKNEIQRDYDKLEHLNTTHVTFTGGNGGAAHEYENIREHPKNLPNMYLKIIK